MRRDYFSLFWEHTEEHCFHRHLKARMVYPKLSFSQYFYIRLPRLNTSKCFDVWGVSRWSAIWGPNNLLDYFPFERVLTE